MALPQPDKCGANELLDNVQNKAEDIKSKLTEQLGLGADASTIRDNLKELLAPLEQAMTEVAPKLAANAPVSLQGGIKDFINGFDPKKLGTPSGKNEAASKLALLEKDFGPKLKDKGLTLNDLIKKAGGALGQDIDVSSLNAGITKDVGAAASFLSGTGTGSLTGELTSALGGIGSAGSNLLGGLTGGTSTALTGGLSSLTGGLTGGLTALKNSATGAPLSFCEISAGQGGFTIPNIEIPADLSGSGVTEEEREVRSSTGLLVIAIKDEYKEIKSVEGKREGSPFFTNIQGYKISSTNSGIILLPSYKEGDKNWAEVKVTYIVELVKEKSVEITQADTNEAKEKTAPVTANINVGAIKSELKAKVDAIKNGTAFTATTKKTNIVTSTGSVIKASTTKDLVTKGANGQKVRATKSVDGIAGKFKIVQDKFINYAALETHSYENVTKPDFISAEFVKKLAAKKNYKPVDSLVGQKWSNFPPIEILSFWSLMWVPSFDGFTLEELKEIKRTGGDSKWDIGFMQFNSDGSVKSTNRALRRPVGFYDGFKTSDYNSSETIPSGGLSGGTIAFRYKYKVLDTIDSNYK